MSLKDTLYEDLARNKEHYRIADIPRFKRRLKKATSDASLTTIQNDTDKAKSSLARRETLVPPITYPEQLPVTQSKDEITQLIRENQVVVIAGETGSGKTTQIPKMLLDMGYGRRGLIGHTQPRRIAARSVAERISKELHAPDMPNIVGHTVRFNDQTSPDTMIKLMTDGILLAEIQHDPLLLAYDAIIIDEAHERSLNIDFLLGYLKQLLPKRPDLKVIVTSATIDPESFSQHFATTNPQGKTTPAPIIEVSGRTYPVEIRYRPLEMEVPSGNPEKPSRIEHKDLAQGVAEASIELLTKQRGDILVFFASEAEIHEVADALSSLAHGKPVRGMGNLNTSALRGVEVLSLFGRQSSAEQHKIFEKHDATRIILSTNIAETSLTVPGIKYVIDGGTARISRYSSRTKVQRLPIEPISQASATQRSGRSGRTSPGIAIRLYSEEDFTNRPEYTDPEILRTHLSSVILTMANLNLGPIEQFPFLQAPDPKAVRDGVTVLTELGAVKGSGSHTSGASGENVRLTQLGRSLARIPTDPRLARMLVEAQKSNVLEAVIIIVAALSIQDVRERPRNSHEDADRAHARLAADSDFLSILKLWEYIMQQQHELSGNQYRKMLKSEFLSYMRIRDWMDMVNQFSQIMRTNDRANDSDRSKKISPREFTYTDSDADAIHISILSALLSQIGIRIDQSRKYNGTRNTSFTIHPSSVLAKNAGQFVMAAELVETSQVFGRVLATITPEWIESQGKHLMKYNYSEPHWSQKRGSAVALERGTLLGIPVVTDRHVTLGKHEPELARELFIRHALVEGEWNAQYAFLTHNFDMLAQAQELEEKTRRRDIVVDDDVLFEFYDQRIPADITSSRHFDSWWKDKSQNEPHLLDFDPEQLIDQDASTPSTEDFPDTFHQDSLSFDIDYNFSPGSTDDGMTLQVPLPLLATLDRNRTQWLVPGLQEELATSLIRSLPKALRKTVVPVPQFAHQAIERMQPTGLSFSEALADELRILGGSGISASDFDWSSVPDHLLMNYAVIDRHGKVLDHSRNLQGLQDRYAGEITSAVASIAQTTHQAGAEGSQDESYTTDFMPVDEASVEQWTEDSLGTIPESIDITVDGHTTQAYPAVIETDSGYSIHNYPTQTAADAAQYTTVLGMLHANVSLASNQVLRGTQLTDRVALENYPYGGIDALIEDATMYVSKRRLQNAGSVIRDPNRVEKLVEDNAEHAPGEAYRHIQQATPGISASRRISEELDLWEGETIDDMRSQLELFIGPHSLTRNSGEQLREIPRYVKAMQARLDLLESDPDKEYDLALQVDQANALLNQKIDSLPSSRQASPTLREVRWLIEEFRVSVYAQNLGTKRSVSLKRIAKALDAL